MKGTKASTDLPKAMLDIDGTTENWTALKSQAMDFPSFPLQIQRLFVIQQLILYNA